MVYTLSKLSKKPATWESTRNFFYIVGATGMVGWGVRWALSQALKFFPGAVAGSALVTFTMTRAIGRAAIAHFLENKRLTIYY